MDSFNIAVIIPVYNAEKYIRKAVESALKQPEVEEVILIEDGSSDGSMKICRQLENRHARVKLLSHKNNENLGAGRTRNLGISSSTSEYIAFLDADDFFLDHRFQTTRKVFRDNPNADGVYEAIGTHFYNDIAKERFEKVMKWASDLGKDILITTVDKPVAPEDLFELLLTGKNGWFSGDGLTVKRKIFEKCGYFDTELKLSQDTELWFRMAFFGKLYPGEICKPVTLRGVHASNRSTDEQQLQFYRVPFWKKLFKLALANRMNKTSNRIILMKHLDHYDHNFVKMKAGVKRKLVKLKNLLVVLIKYPSFALRCLI